MRNKVIRILGGATAEEHHKAHAAKENYQLLYNQMSNRAYDTERQLEKMEEQFLQASMQAEQLLERLRQTEQRLEHVTEEQRNASGGWTEEVKRRETAELGWEDASRKLLASEAAFAEMVNERDTARAALDNKPKLEFDVIGGGPVEHPGSRSPLRLVMSNGKYNVELRSLSYSKANMTLLSNIMRAANTAIER